MVVARAFSTTSLRRIGRPTVAVIGCGPAGLYACSRLVQKLPECRVDIFDRNQVPYGLVQYGVAPDHSDMKKCTKQFERMFNENRDRLSLYCNVSVGDPKELLYDELCLAYDSVILAYGASKPRKLNLDNENADNCFSGSDFVSWYNGQPRHNPPPKLNDENAVVLGNGNVAIDCSRILLCNPEKLAHTDVPEAALHALRNSHVQNVRIFGRRGPIEASFTIKELRELLTLGGCSSSCRIPQETILEIQKLLADSPQMERPKRRILELMLKSVTPKHTNCHRQCSIEFFLEPIKIHVDEITGRVKRLDLRNKLDGRIVEVPCGLLIYAIGFEHILLNGVPTTDDNRILMWDWCRVPSSISNVYATGWCAHAARGVILDSQMQAFSVVDELIADWKAGKFLEKDPLKEVAPNLSPIKGLLDQRKVDYITWDDWCYADECEQRMGALLGKPREKIYDLKSLLRIWKN